MAGFSLIKKVAVGRGDESTVVVKSMGAGPVASGHDVRPKKKSRLERELESTLPSGSKDHVAENASSSKRGAEEPEVHTFVLSSETESGILDILWQ